VGTLLVAAVAASAPVQDLVAGRTADLECTHSPFVVVVLVPAEGDLAARDSSWSCASVVQAAGLDAAKLLTTDESHLGVMVRVRAGTAVAEHHLVLVVTQTAFLA
jgi:hypothetical protein